MSTRRHVISGALALAGVGAVEGSAAAPAGATASPINEGISPGDVRRIGVVANDPSAASANTKALGTLVAPSGNFAGRLWFPNTTGADVYHFDGVIIFRDDVRIDLSGSTLRFHKDSEASDSNTGFMSALRNFQIENGSIVVDYDMGHGVSSAGSAIHIGNRGSDSAHMAPTYDSQLPAALGNIVLRNLRIVSNVAGGNAIEMTGGLSGVTIENVWIEGGGRLNGGIYYEFGWATPGTANLRETSHAHNMRFINISVSNLNPAAGSAITLAGAYNTLVQGLWVDGASAVFNGTPGESLNFRPWKARDQIGAKRTIVLHNIIASRIAATAITFTGAQLSANGFLAARALTPVTQTDLADYYLDGFALDGTSNGWGILTSANKAEIRNGRITGFQRGIVQTDDCTRISIDGVDVIGCTQSALQLGLPSKFWNPPREKMGEVRNCFIAGNSTAAAGTSPAIELDTCAGFLIQNNRIGYELTHDGQAETTQGNAIQLGAHCSRVMCQGNYVGGVSAGSVAYYGPANSEARGNTVHLPGGILSTHGSWGV
jgi:hypothetical protein